jgi:hypothetical protein
MIRARDKGVSKLTGQTPFDAKELMASGLDVMRLIIREQEPARPSTRLSMLVAADLTTVARHRQAEPARLGTLLRGDLDSPSGELRPERAPKADLRGWPEAAAQCELERRALMQRGWNDPSIVAWCPFNEGWSQHDTLRYAEQVSKVHGNHIQSSYWTLLHKHYFVAVYRASYRFECSMA